jgi:hypothetical protein
MWIELNPGRAREHGQHAEHPQLAARRNAQHLEPAAKLADAVEDELDTIDYLWSGSRGPQSPRFCGPAFKIQICRVAEKSSKGELVVGANWLPALTRQSKLHLWPSHLPSSDDRLPKERSNKRNHNNAKDKAPRVVCFVVVGGQPVGIAHAKLLGRPPASRPH